LALPKGLQKPHSRKGGLYSLVLEVYILRGPALIPVPGIQSVFSKYLLNEWIGNE
jgi:hypothetical protein